MPQLTLEHSANLELERCIDLQQLLVRLHGTLAAEAGADLEKCKSRAVCHQTFAVGEGQPAAAFVHLEVRLLDGRSEATTEATGRALLELLTATLSPFAGGFALQVTVELVEMPRTAYFKTSLIDR